jgi:putative FmdB family regulatory protein
VPTYVYRRPDGSTFELRQSINDAPLDRCPDTDAPVRRVVQAAAVKFNGGGYYASDYGGKNASA